jgi:hypothetical protein
MEIIISDIGSRKLFEKEMLLRAKTSAKDEERTLIRSASILHNILSPE